MEKIIMVRYGEIHLKGLNRPYFESLLKKQMIRALNKYDCKIVKGDGRYFIYGINDIENAMQKLTKIFGIHSVSPVVCVEKDIELIFLTAKETLTEAMSFQNIKTFKVESKRGDKRFELNSMEISREAGAYLLNNLPELKVDVKNPDIRVHIEIRDKAYIYTRLIKGQGGMPTGSAGKAALLLSGGIDSPVAGYMCAKRGVDICAVYFHAFPFTGEAAKQKVVELSKILSGYVGKFNLHVVHFTQIQEEIYKKCPHEQLTIIMRRYMMDIAQRIAKKEGALALITGESIGQVASQTLNSLACTDDVADMPVFRPLIGMDKIEIIEIARKIGTYETSILPYEDCCTIFVAKHPTTRPDIEQIKNSEEVLNKEELILSALEKTEIIQITNEG